MLDNEGYKYTLGICSTYAFAGQQGYANAPRCYHICTFPVLIADRLVFPTCLLSLPDETLDPSNAVTDSRLWFIIILISSR